MKAAACINGVTRGAGGGMYGAAWIEPVRMVSTNRSSVSAGYIKSLVDFAVARGATGADLLRRAAIDPGVLKSLDNRIPLPALMELFAAAKEATEDPALPLHFGRHSDMAEASIAGLITRAADTVAEAFLLLNRYGRLLVDVEYGGKERFLLTREGERLLTVDTLKDAAALPELAEFTFARFAAVHDRMFPDRSYLREVHFTHAAPPHRAAYDEVFGVPVFFENAPNRIISDAAALSARVTPWTPKYAVGILGPHADELLEAMGRRSEIIEHVQALLMEGMPMRQVEKRLIAQKLGMSVQTFHRRLKAEGTTYEALLREAQLRLASKCLRARIPVKQTAHMVGFSSTASFSRAFKRWTGHSPKSHPA